MITNFQKFFANAPNDTAHKEQKSTKKGACAPFFPNTFINYLPNNTALAASVAGSTV